MDRDHPWYHEDDEAWLNTDHEDLWIFDKLILAKRLGYNCGPAGVEVYNPGYYIVRPCVNFIGLGLGSQIFYLEKDTNHLPVGTFWCQIFKGRHLSLDYKYGEQFLCIEGFRDSKPDDLTHWGKWLKIDDTVQMPEIIQKIIRKYKYSNCEFIDGNLIEVHLRRNPNFCYGNSEYLPVFTDEFDVPDGYEFINDPGLNNRVGAFIK